MQPDDALEFLPKVAAASPIFGVRVAQPTSKPVTSQPAERLLQGTILGGN